MLEDQLEGLCPSPEPTHIYVELGKTEDGVVHPWHLYDKLSDRATPIFSPCIMGQLFAIELKIQEFQRKENFKIMFKVRSGDRIWFIRSGVETTFTRGIVLALRTLNDDQLHGSLKFYAKPGDTAVYGNIYTIMNDPVVTEFDKDAKLLPIINELQRRLGQEPQDIKKLQQEFRQSKQASGGGR